ncbi:MAG: hypothetical protein IKZ00_08110 [Bacteroidaceae bacterium]|nr:hypothetical protein [Bacteroidaceae bacterium]MBR5606908.1 hypothetical protein [Bacteroidaceae bacterium]
MKEKLTKLRNTMALVETKGESTKIMAQCLQYVEQLISECDKQEQISEPLES